MSDQRFEAWWSGSPQRAGLSATAKEIARGIWRAAQQDLVTDRLRGKPIIRPDSALARLLASDADEEDDTIPLAQPRTGNKGSPC